MPVTSIFNENLEIKPNHWALSLVKRAAGEHTFLILEGADTEGNAYIYRLDFGYDPDDSPDIAKISFSNLVQPYAQQDLKDMLKAKKYNYITRGGLTDDMAKTFFSLVSIEMQRARDGLIVYSRQGEAKAAASGNKSAASLGIRITREQVNNWYLRMYPEGASEQDTGWKRYAPEALGILFNPKGHNCYTWSREIFAQITGEVISTRTHWKIVNIFAGHSGAISQQKVYKLRRDDIPFPLERLITRMTMNEALSYLLCSRHLLLMRNFFTEINRETLCIAFNRMRESLRNDYLENIKPTLLVALEQCPETEYKEHIEDYFNRLGNLFHEAVYEPPSFSSTLSSVRQLLLSCLAGEPETLVVFKQMEQQFLHQTLSFRGKEMFDNYIDILTRESDLVQQIKSFYEQLSYFYASEPETTCTAQEIQPWLKISLESLINLFGRKTNILTLTIDCANEIASKASVGETATILDENFNTHAKQFLVFIDKLESVYFLQEQKNMLQNNEYDLYESLIKTKKMLLKALGANLLPDTLNSSLRAINQRLADIEKSSGLASVLPGRRIMGSSYTRTLEQIKSYLMELQTTDMLPTCSDIATELRRILIADYQLDFSTMAAEKFDQQTEPSLALLKYILNRFEEHAGFDITEAEVATVTCTSSVEVFTL